MVANKAFERDDPMELVGHTYPVRSQEGHDRAAARTFIEEYALMGWPAARIRGLFDSAEYTACFDIKRRRGGAFVDDLIATVFGVRADG
jgi:hypothetical protein